MTFSRPWLAALFAAAAILLSPASYAERTHQGLWWASPAGSESGWGLNITHQGNTLFATWFTYDTDGSPMWLVMSEGARQVDYYDGGYYGSMMYYTDTYEGPLYRTTGPAFTAATFNPNAVGVTEVGMARLSFDERNSPRFSYTVNNFTQTKTLTRQVYASPAPDCDTGVGQPATPNYQDLWWRSPAGSESGWGVNIAHQGDTLFVTWFTYGADGKAMWYVMSNGAKAANGSYAGALYRTRGPAFSATPWSPSGVTVTEVGSGTLTFTDASNGVFAYTVDGVTQSKSITRQVYSGPVPVCHFP
jgi:hypothetical protein